MSLLAFADTPPPSLAKAVVPVKNRVVSEASFGTRDMTRGSAWEVLKGFKVGSGTWPRQPLKKGCSLAIRWISRG